MVTLIGSNYVNSKIAFEMLRRHLLMLREFENREVVEELMVCLKQGNEAEGKGNSRLFYYF